MMEKLILFLRNLSPEDQPKRKSILHLVQAHTGPKVFLATIHSGQNQLLFDENKNLLLQIFQRMMFFIRCLYVEKQEVARLWP